MCGLIAFWQKQDSVSEQKLSSALSTLSHRGPDNQSVWLTQHGRIGLAHARLGIIDLINGDQPLHSPDGTLHAVVNGEFYDHKKIRYDLETKGYVFSTQTDSEILLALYHFYGTDCLPYLNGEFAFVLYDQNKHLLFAARDRFGIKPLFFAKHQNNLYFASEGKALLALGIPAKWNEKAIWQMMAGVPSPQSSCFNQIYAIKPAHYILTNVDQNQFNEVSYWSMALNPVYGVRLSDHEYLTKFDALFSQSVKRRLQADVPIACYLSGGIDSSLVTAIAALYQKPLTAFHITFGDSPEFNETEYAAEVAQYCQIDLHCMPVSIEDIVKYYAKTIWHTEWIIFNGNSVAKYLLSQYARKQGYKVVLTGEGADELLAGYGHLRGEYFRRNSYPISKQIISQYDSLAENYLLDESIIKLKKQLGYVPYHFCFSHEKLMQPLYNAEFHQRHQHHLAIDEILNDPLLVKETDPVALAHYLQIKTLFPMITLSIVGDRVEMANSIEARLPFLDLDLVNFILKLPKDLKVRNFRNKFILTESMKAYLPETIIQRSKYPFYAPNHVHSSSTQTAPLYNFMKEIFYSDLVKDVPFLNQAAVIHYFNEVMKVKFHQRSNEFHLLHMLLSLCLLGNEFKLS